MVVQTLHMLLLHGFSVRLSKCENPSFHLAGHRHGLGGEGVMTGVHALVYGQ